MTPCLEDDILESRVLSLYVLLITMTLSRILSCVHRIQRSLMHLTATFDSIIKLTLTVPGTGRAFTVGCWIMWPKMRTCRPCSVNPVTYGLNEIGKNCEEI
jgi:hypothetical protein